MEHNYSELPLVDGKPTLRWLASGDVVYLTEKEHNGMTSEQHDHLTSEVHACQIRLCLNFVTWMKLHPLISDRSGITINFL